MLPANRQTLPRHQGADRPYECARCGKPIEDAADEFCTPCWAAQATPAHKPGEPPLVHPDHDAADEFCTPCWAAQATPAHKPDDPPLVHPDHEWSVRLTFVVAVAVVILTVFVIATWAGGVR